ncbi:unnamed protein product [Parascedosporium putredinis]|uniref:Uncharacterized protein n=1 Tax=Parascedosporium putredinis TaxID=1442378 RepID=A0A9P1GZK1_9PEZI|nr:unnamed protein product [Parascedosporium putredinis]CAI7990910.1 unnamed protein product [Parascedosporium putredinis]
MNTSSHPHTLPASQCHIRRRWRPVITCHDTTHRCGERRPARPRRGRGSPVAQGYVYRDFRVPVPAPVAEPGSKL